MNKKDIEVVAEIKKTTDYEKFQPEPLYMNSTRINYLLSRVYKDHKSLPLIEVKKVGDKLEVINDQDSFYAAQHAKLPIYYYETFRKGEVKPLGKKHLFPTDEKIDNVITLAQGDN